MKTTVWPKIHKNNLIFHCFLELDNKNTYGYNGYPGYLYGGIAPFDETVVTLTVPFAAGGATAGLFVLPVELSVFGCTAGATAYNKSIEIYENSL